MRKKWKVCRELHRHKEPAATASNVTTTRAVKLQVAQADLFVAVGLLFVPGEPRPAHLCFRRCISAKLTRPRLAGARPSVPNSTAP
jgi:hypothetical protein